MQRSAIIFLVPYRPQFSLFFFLWSPIIYVRSLPYIAYWTVLDEKKNLAKYDIKTTTTKKKIIKSLIKQAKHVKMFSNFGLTLTREVWRRRQSDNRWILTSPHAMRQLRVTTSLLKQGHVQGKCELPQKQLLIIIRRLYILCLKRFKQQILNFCDELWQGGVVM